MNSSTTAYETVYSQRRVQFDYTPVSNVFKGTLTILVGRGEPVVLLGPRGSGKQLVLAAISRDESEVQSVIVRLRCEAFVDQPDEFDRDIYDQLRSQGVAKSDAADADAHETWKDHLGDYLLANHGRVVLLVSNVDSLPSLLARKFLKSLRKLNQLCVRSRGTLSVILTGSFDLAPLVYGQDSEFAVAKQFVLQGFDQVWFDRFVTEYTEAFGLRVTTEGLDFLFRLTGGDLLMLRLVAETLMDLRRAVQTPNARAIDVGELEEVHTAILNRGSVFSDVVLRPFARLESSKGSLELLETLLDEDACDLPPAAQTQDGLLRDQLPTEPELAGVARRDGAKLYWSSPLMRTLAREHFTKWTLGDCYACCSNWEKAFEYYREAINNKLPRTLSTNQRPRSSAAISAFSVELLRIAGTPDACPDQLRRFLTDGLVAILGVDEVTFWHFDDRGCEWNPVENAPDQQSQLMPSPDRDALARIEEHLKPPHFWQHGVNPIDGVDGLFGVVAKLPCPDHLTQECAVVSGFRSNNPLTSDRRASVESLLNTFAVAYRQTLTNAAEAERARIQKRLLGAIPSVIELFNSSGERTMQALRSTGDKLRCTDFRRVMFSLVDEYSSIIEGVVDCRSADQPDIAEMTSFSLNIPLRDDGSLAYEDIQQECVKECMSIIVPNARMHPLVNQKVRRATNLQAIVLVPLIHQDRVIGTMHVERQDGQLPSPEYIAELEVFAGQLAQAIYITTWMDAIEDVNHQQTNSSFLIDLADRVKFANEAAAKHFPLSPGWQDAPVKVDQRFAAEIRQVISDAKQHGASYSHPIASDGRNSPLQVAEATPIRDWRKKICGLSVHLHDYSELSHLLSALKQFAKCHDFKALSLAVLDVLRAMGYEWARIYRVDPSLQDRMLGIAEFGLPTGSDGAKAFAEGRAFLERNSYSEPIWKAIDDRRTTVYSTDKAYRFDQYYTTRTGLTIYNVQDAACPEYLLKRDRDRWVDLPLFAGGESDTPLGKITVSCPSDTSPRRLKYLSVLAAAAGAGLSAILAVEDREIELSAKRRSEMLRAIGETSHQLKSKLESLSTLIEDLKVERPNVPEFVVNLTTRLADISETLDETKERLKPLRCEMRSVEIIKLLRECFAASLKEDQVRVVGTSENLKVDVDPKLFREAINELVLNAKKAVTSVRSLQISATVTPIMRRGLPWVRLQIRDNGPGIPVTDLERIFDEFYSQWLHSDTEGTGLGLSYVTSIIAAHGGRIRAIESEAGAVFEIEFPRNATERESVFRRETEAEAVNE